MGIERQKQRIDRSTSLVSRMCRELFVRNLSTGLFGVSGSLESLESLESFERGRCDR